MQVIRDAEASAKPSTANTGPFNAYAAALAPVQIDSAALAAAKAKPNKGIIRESFEIQSKSRLCEILFLLFFC